MFLEQFDPVQIRYMGSLWRDLLHAVEASARSYDAVSFDHVSLLSLYKVDMFEIFKC